MKKLLTKITTENAALASGASFLVSRTIQHCGTEVVSDSIASQTCMSNEAKKLVNKGCTKPTEGVEPSEHEMTTSIPPRAVGWQRAYQGRLILSNFGFVLFLLLYALYLLPTSALASVVVGHSNTTSLSNGLVGYWPLDGGNTNWTTGVVSDMSGNRNNGNMVSLSTSTSPVVGKIGGALNFTGSNYVQVPNSTSLNLAGSAGITVSSWIKMSSTTPAEGTVGEWGSIGGTVRQFQQGIIQVGSPYFLGWNVSDNGNARASVRGNTPLVPGVWYHLVTIWQNNGTMTGYVNNVLQTMVNANSSEAIPTSLNSSAGAVCLGVTNNANTSTCVTNVQQLLGTLDDVRIYNRALSRQEVKQLYAAGSVVVARSNTTTLASGLVGYWPLDGKTTNWNTGTTQDASGNGNTGQMIGMSTTTSPVTGKIGGALNFNGGTSYVASSNSNGFGLSNAITQSLWLKTNSAHYQRLIQFYRSLNASAVILASGIDNTGSDVNDGKPTAGYRDASNALQVVRGPTSISDGKWHLLTWAISGATGTLYVDGIPVATTSNINNASTFTFFAQPITIGAISGGGLSFANGSIDDVRIYNRALSAQEIKQLYAEGAAVIAHSNTTTLSSGLVGYWPLDGGTTSWTTDTTQDTSGNGNTGQLIGMSTTTSPVVGKIGGALKFNGASSIITTTSNPLSSLIGSVSVWVKPRLSAPPSLEQIFVGSGVSGPNTSRIYILHLTNGDFGMSLGLTANTDSNKIIPVSSWSHLVLTWNNGTYVMYINGIQVKTGAYSGITTLVGCPSMGGYNNAGCSSFSNGFYNGAIDDVRIYNRALSAQEVSQLYLMGK